MIVLRKYQEPFFTSIIEKIFAENHSSVLGVLPTGGGKSVVIGKLCNTLPGRSLVLTHREEILNQNSEWINDVGILSSKKDTVKYNNKTVVCMVQTLDSRIKKYGVGYLGQFDNIVLDEVHILIFEKVFAKYSYKRLIGFTATPLTNKRISKTIDGVEFTAPYTLDALFETMVEGPDTQDLIDQGQLCQDHNITLRLPDFDKLKESDSSPDGYTKKSLNEVYENTASLDILNKAYNSYCKGKKTLIFNPSHKINVFVYNHFKALGLNVKMFDSVSKAEINPDTGKRYTRKEIIAWFENERDAILINTNVFTTGFNVTDVEVVVVNRATKSLSLWLQMVGRGSRTTDKIYKNHFTVIDLGQNIENHGIWSKRRNWKDYFKSPGWRRKKVIDLLDTWECSKCESFNVKGETVCEFCGTPKSVIEIDGKTKKTKEGDLQVLEKTPPPKANSIMKYTIANNGDKAFAFKLLSNKIVELFISHRVSKEFYEKRKDDYIDSKGVSKKGFESTVRKIFTPVYIAIQKNQEIPGDYRKLETEFSRVIKRVEKLYD